jgi:hypothetical protein
MSFEKELIGDGDGDTHPSNLNVAPIRHTPAAAQGSGTGPPFATHKIMPMGFDHCGTPASDLTPVPGPARGGGSRS